MMASGTPPEVQKEPTLSQIGSNSEVIENTIHRILGQSTYRELRRVRCECTQDVLALYGEVPSYYLKQVALETAKRFAHGKVINNCIQVVHPEV